MWFKQISVDGTVKPTSRVNNSFTPNATFKLYTFNVLNHVIAFKAQLKATLNLVIKDILII